MPIDVRKLIFSEAELVEAFAPYSPSSTSDFARASVEKIEIDEPAQGQGLIVHVYYASRDPKNPTCVTLDEYKILEGLIRLCRDLHIPLPKRSKKFLKKHQNGLAVTFGMTGEDIRAANL